MISQQTMSLMCRLKKGTSSLSVTSLPMRLGPGLLGDAVYKAFKTTGGKVPVVGPILGLYGLFMTGKNNPSEIELTYANMWFGDKAHAWKGVAHGQQDIAWWYGAAKVYQGINNLESQAIALKRGKKVDEMLAAKEQERALLE